MRLNAASWVLIHVEATTGVQRCCGPVQQSTAWIRGRCIDEPWPPHNDYSSVVAMCADAHWQVHNGHSAKKDAEPVNALVCMCTYTLIIHTVADVTGLLGQQWPHQQTRSALLPAGAAASRALLWYVFQSSRKNNLSANHTHVHVNESACMPHSIFAHMLQPHASATSLMLWLLHAPCKCL